MPPPFVVSTEAAGVYPLPNLRAFPACVKSDRLKSLNTQNSGQFQAGSVQECLMVRKRGLPPLHCLLK